MKWLFVTIATFILIWGYVAYLRIKFHRQIISEIRDFCEREDVAKKNILSLPPSQSLPQPVERYLNWAIGESNRRFKKVLIKQSGTFKTKPNEEKKALHAEEYLNMIRPEYIWHASIQFWRGVNFIVRDFYQNGRGGVLGLLAGVFPVVCTESKTVAMGALQRWAGEAVWFPHVFLDEKIFQWSPINFNTAKATIRHEELQVEMLFHFDESGRPAYVTAERYFQDGNRSILQPWRGDFSDWRNINNVWIPHKLEATWQLPTGPFKYVELNVDKVLHEPAIYECNYADELSLQESID